MCFSEIDIGSTLNTVTNKREFIAVCISIC